MTKEYLETILTEYGVAFTDSLADRLLKEFEPCEDTISRQTVIETIDDCNSDGLKGIFCSYDDGERNGLWY